MNDNQLDSKMKRLKNTMKNMPVKTDKSVILEKIHQGEDKRKYNKIWMFGGSLASIIIFSLLLLSTIESFNFNNLFGLGTGNSQDVELLNINVEVHSDEGRLGSIGIPGENGEYEKIVPTAITYAFAIKNNGNESLGSMEEDGWNEENFTFENGIHVTIVPEDRLIETSEEIMGFNLFDSTENRTGSGANGPLVLEPDQDGYFELHFTIGAEEENTELPLIPSEQNIEKLMDEALNAELLLTVSDEEIARFQLSELAE